MKETEERNLPTKKGNITSENLLRVKFRRFSKTLLPNEQKDGGQRTVHILRIRRAQLQHTHRVRVVLAQQQEHAKLFSLSSLEEDTTLSNLLG